MTPCNLVFVRTSSTIVSKGAPYHFGRLSWACGIELLALADVPLFAALPGALGFPPLFLLFAFAPPLPLVFLAATTMACLHESERIALFSSHKLGIIYCRGLTVKTKVEPHHLT